MKSSNIKQNLSYVSLFSGAGVGCHGFKMEEFDCIATVEILEKRLKFQKFNNKCIYADGYIPDDIKKTETKNKLDSLIVRYLTEQHKKSIDVLIATPPCQGMSVANHKKKNEKGRNSLVVESITLTLKYSPKYFIFENVKSFLNTICTDIDGKDKKITEAIDSNLAGKYNILKKVINFKNYGSNSSRTRTLVIGVRKDITQITPYDLLPSEQKEKTLFEVIGDLKPLKQMGEIDPNDIYHQFKPYAEYMREWIKPLKEGESAFDFKETYPYKLVNGEKVSNTNKNGDKYRRQIFSKVAPCIHTRNDILASQNTVHPKDDRVFSIRELMLMMAIPNDFKWADRPLEMLNSLSLSEKQNFLKKEEMNIRASIGEAVPTEIFRRIASNIKRLSNQNFKTTREVKDVIEKYELNDQSKLQKFIQSSEFSLNELINIIELANAKRNETSAYYTNPSICFSIVKSLPDFSNRRELRILEPSVGAGSFLPLIFAKYSNIKKVTVDVVDIDNNSIENVLQLLKKFGYPSNFEINAIHDDFLTHKFERKYDLVIGNPPFGKVKDKQILAQYKFSLAENEPENIYIFFLEKALEISEYVAFVLPKAFISSPIYKKTRQKVEELVISKIIDYGEKGFNGVKIETISLIIKNSKLRDGNEVNIESYITNKYEVKSQKYITDKHYPNWLLYRDNFFDQIAKKMKFNVYDVFRDRQITKKITLKNGTYRVLKSRNISDGGIIDIEGYDCYIDNLGQLAVSKFLNKADCILIPNLTYKPRATLLPQNSIVDGSVAILTLRNKSDVINKESLHYYATDEFRNFYMKARNLGTRSLNIDSNSVFYFGILKSNG